MKQLLLTLLGASAFMPTLAVAGEIRGGILDENSSPVPHATLVLCDQNTGIPVSKNTFKPFITDTPDSNSILTFNTNSKGRFALEDVPPGDYRLIAQSWPDNPGVRNILEKNGKKIVLHGVEDNVSVPSKAAKDVEMHPLGNCTVVIDEEFPNSDALLLISTSPPGTDAILGFVSWQGAFLQNLIGANRMPYGVTEISGLPPGKIHLSVFAADSNGGFGSGSVNAMAAETATADYIPIVCGWSNGQHKPPDELQDVYDEVKEIIRRKNIISFIDESLSGQGIDVKHNGKQQNPLSCYYPHLQVELALPSGREARLADVLASVQYIQLQKRLKQRSKKANE